MPRSAGTFTLVTPGNPVSAGTTINPTHHNSTLDDIATALTASIANDGQTPILANLPMSNFKHTGAAVATATGQYLTYGQAGANLGEFNDAIEGAPRVDVASVAGTTNLETALSNYIRITGTNTITGITLTDGHWRHVLAGGAFAITTGASLVIDGLVSGTTYTFAAGDTFDVYGEASSVVRVSGVRLPGEAVGFAIATSTGGASTANVIPYDTSIPQSGEGAEYLTVAYTPRYATSKLLLTFIAPVLDASVATIAAFSFFRDATADAVASFAKPLGTVVDSIYMTAVTNATATTATTFKMRYGPSSAAATVHVNQIAGPANRFGAASIATFTVTEIKQ